jgi:hypothetical protein
MVFSGVLGAAVLGAVTFMASVVVGDMFWRLVLQGGGLGVCLLGIVAVVVLTRRWAASTDDFWWPDPDL